MIPNHLLEAQKIRGDPDRTHLSTTSGALREREPPEQMMTPEEDEAPRTDSPTEAAQVGARLDQHHAPETNGRMATCRRCGMRTDGPDGRHAPAEQQLTQARRWLDTQSLSAKIAAMRIQRDT